MLAVTSEGPLRGRTLAVTGEERIIGRAADSDLRLDDPYVSRRHAVVRPADSGIVIADLGSVSGTLVNGRQIQEPALLRGGDEITVGATTLQLVERTPPGPQRSPETARPSDPDPAVNFGVGTQRGGTINNVGRDQYLSQYYQIKIAPMRRRARLLLRAGIACFLAGVGVYLVMFVVFASEIVGWIDSLFSSAGGSAPPGPPDISFQVLLLVPVAFLLAFSGVVLMVTSLLMRRRANRWEDRAYG